MKTPYDILFNKKRSAMADEIINFDLPVDRSSIIKVLGIGGGGNNAVNHMYERGIKDVNFVICNTDLQALNSSLIPVKVQIGEALTEGRGAGSRPEVGRQSAVENIVMCSTLFQAIPRWCSSLQEWVAEPEPVQYL
jgi:cell division GTPase FtsZ